MKNIIKILLFAFLIYSSQATDVYQSNSIYVKYKSKDKEAELQSSTRNYSSEPAFTFAIPTGRAISKQADSLLFELKKVKKITFNSKIDPIKMARKFQSLPNVEYAEPIPKNYIFDNESNDPELPRLYHLYITKAVQAWGQMTGKEVLIGIVDTGIDFEHEDLKQVIWKNQGELGLDGLGNDKSTNGIDDDNNGRIDDWRGWDFGSELGFDNDPSYGSDHGVHVAGIAAAQWNNSIGISGVCPTAKILPVKIGGNFGIDNSVNHEYDGLLYAAIMGAKVINCSWGSSGFSQTDETVVNTATALGAIVVAAAGNNNANERFYPASYENVLSVASSDDEDIKSSFSNYNNAVDITAPGTFIFSTEPNNKYDYKSGTSMASPVTAGAAAVIVSQFPDYSPLQIKALLEVNADNIDEQNSAYLGLMGSGRLNLLKTINRENTFAINITGYTVNPIGVGAVLNSGAKVIVNVNFKNILDSLDNLEIIVENDEFLDLSILNRNFNFTALSTNEEFGITNQIEFTIPENTPDDYTINLPLAAYHKDKFLKKMYVSFVINPSYRDLKNSEIGTSITSKGNIGYNDFPNNTQGLGFQYGDLNALFEGGVMITQMGKPYVADNVRTRSGFRDNNLFSLRKIESAENESYEVITSLYTDKKDGFINVDTLALGIDIKQESYLYKDEGLNKSILIRLELYNNNSFDMDSIFTGLFFDWDMSDSGGEDYIYFDETENLGVVEVPSSNDFPKIIVKMHSDQFFNCYAIDNAGTEDSFGIYNGFSENEKQTALTSGAARLESSNGKDASMVLSAGPMNIPAGGKSEIVFSINVVDDVLNFKDINDKLEFKIKNLDPITKVNISPTLNIVKLYPNPANTNQTLSALIYSDKSGHVNLKIVDYRGKKVLNLGSEKLINGNNPISFTVAGISQGMYYLVIEEENELFSYPFTIVNE